MEYVQTMLESKIFSKITKNSEKFCFMHVIIGYISIVLYSDSSWSDTAISPEASFHMTPGKILSKLNILCENCMKSDIKSSPVTWVISKKSLKWFLITKIRNLIDRFSEPRIYCISLDHFSEIQNDKDEDNLTSENQTHFGCST